MVISLLLLSFLLFSETAFTVLSLVTLMTLLLSNQKYFLNSILGLEFLALLNLFNMSMMTPYLSSAFMLIFLTFSVCEAILGLTIIVYLSRFKSLEMMNLN